MYCNRQGSGPPERDRDKVTREVGVPLALRAMSPGHPTYSDSAKQTSSRTLSIGCRMAALGNSVSFLPYLDEGLHITIRQNLVF